jgi:hypothetical protein
MNGRVEAIETSQLRGENRPLIRLSAPSPPQETAGEKALDGVQGTDDSSSFDPGSKPGATDLKPASLAHKGRKPQTMTAKTIASNMGVYLLSNGQLMNTLRSYSAVTPTTSFPHALHPGDLVEVLDERRDPAAGLLPVVVLVRGVVAVLGE